MRLSNQTIRRLSTAAGIAALLGSVSTAALGAEQIETVVVTVERHAEDLQTVPESVATVNDDQLASIFQSGQDIRALAARVPGLYAESSNGRVAPRFYIRGLGNTDFDLAASQPVSVVMDEVVLENVSLKAFPVFDVERTGVLRGPQAPLFGRNTPAGIVKIDTVRPTNVFDARGSLSIGSHGTVALDSAIGGPIIADRLAGRVSVLLQRRSDFIDNGFTGEDDVYGGYTD